MKKFLKSLIVLSIAAFTAFGLFACSGKDDKKSENTLTVGMECGYDPFNFTQTYVGEGSVKISNADGYANGYDVMIAKKVAEELGRELVIVKYDWDALIPAVQTGTLDFIIAGMSPTAERRASIDFSDSYYESQLVIVVRKDGNFAGAQRLSDFNGATIVAQNGTFHDKALEREAEENAIKRYTPLGTFPEMINALNTKVVDGYVAEEPGAIADCSKNPNFTYIPLVNNDTGFTASEEDVQVAVGLKKGSELTEKVNEALAKIDAATRLEMMQKANEYSSEKNDGGLFKIVATYYSWILKGIGYTLLVSLIGTIVGLLIGFLVGIYRTMPIPKNRFLRWLKKAGDWILNAYVEIFRGTPMMVQALVIFWGFALLNDGRTLNVIFSGLLIVSINTGAYMAEIVRGGILSIDKGQFEGAQAIGMTHFQTMLHIVLPQAFRNILPSVANEFVINIKDTSVLNVIGFTELFFQAKTIVAATADTFGTYLLIAAIYFVLTFAITRFLRLLEKKLDGKKNYTVFGSQSDPEAEIHIKEA